MSRRPRRNPSPAVKAKVALAAVKGEKMLASIAISMDGKGSWPDNVFVERLWRAVKYEEVYLKAYDTVNEARASIGSYLAFYNGRKTPFDP